MTSLAVVTYTDARIRHLKLEGHDQLGLDELAAARLNVDVRLWRTQPPKYKMSKGMVRVTSRLLG